MAFRYPRETDNYGNDPPQREAENQSCYCRPCGMNFKTWEALHDHKSRHPRHKKTYCVHCSKEFATEDATVTHRRLVGLSSLQTNCHLTVTSSMAMSKISPAPIVEQYSLVSPVLLTTLKPSYVRRLLPSSSKSVSSRSVSTTRIGIMLWTASTTETLLAISLSHPLTSPLNPPVSIFAAFLCLTRLVLIVEAPQLKPTESPQSPPSTYNTQAASDTDVQSTYCPTENATDDTKLTAQSDAPGESEDLMWFIEPENHATKNGNAHIRQVDPTYLRTANDDVDFPALGSLSLHSKAPTDNKLKSKAWVKPNSKSAAPPAVHNAWTNNLSSAANVKGARSAIPSPWGQKQSSSSTPSSANPNVPAARSNFPLVNKIALAPASIKEKFQYHPFDPDQPKFDISPFFNDYIKKYKCPYRTCT